MIRTDDSAALAANWRMVLAVDAGLGAVVAVVGVVTLLAVNLTIGVLMVVAGTAYVALVVSRARRWLLLRRQADL